MVWLLCPSCCGRNGSLGCFGGEKEGLRPKDHSAIRLGLGGTAVQWLTKRCWYVENVFCYQTRMLVNVLREVVPRQK